ncbi:hypothetical protein D3C85_748940 [compost metagenome]
MEDKVITFYQETYWTGCGGDCCPDQEWEVWNTDPDEHPVNGSCHSREDCYISAMQYFGYPIAEMTDEACWDYSGDELESIAREWGIVVDFVS